MRKLTLYILISTLAFGCMTPKKFQKWCALCPSKDTTIISTEIIQDTIVSPADSSFYYALLSCRNGKVEVEKILAEYAGKSKASKPIVKITPDGKLSVTCPCKEEKQVIERLITTIDKLRTVQAPPIEVDKRNKWERFVDSFSGLIFSILAATCVMMLLYWFLFKRKGSEKSPPKPHNIT